MWKGITEGTLDSEPEELNVTFQSAMQHRIISHLIPQNFSSTICKAEITFSSNFTRSHL